MTDTFDTKLDRLHRREAALQTQMDVLINTPPDEKNPTEKWARSVSALGKAIDETAARCAAAQAEIAAQTHTRYEDMPPPTPEDEARFHERFRKLIGEVLDEHPEESALE